jgi:hypothetical protein
MVNILQYHRSLIKNNGKPHGAGRVTAAQSGSASRAIQPAEAKEQGEKTLLLFVTCHYISKAPNSLEMDLKRP